MPSNFSYLFGESPAAKGAYDARNSAYQGWLDSRKQAVQQQRTDDVKMARANAMGNLLTTMVQPIGWAVGGKGNSANTGGVQPYDERQYLEAFNRAVKASDDLRNIGSMEDEYQFKLADEAYRRQLSLEDEERRNKFNMDKLAEQYNQKALLAQQKFEQDMQKEQEKARLRMELAEFNAAHKIVGRGSGGSKFTIDEREKIKLLEGYLAYAKGQRDMLKEPMDYQKWLGTLGYSTQTATATENKPPADPDDEFAQYKRR